MNSNQAYLVGEEGPELFLPSTAGEIIPNGKNRYLNGRKGGAGSAVEMIGGGRYQGPDGGGMEPGGDRAGMAPLTIPYARSREGQAVSQEAATAAAKAFAGAPMEINYKSLRVGDIDVVSRSEAEAMAGNAARRGAEQGTSAALAALRNSVATRRRVGL